MLPNSLAASLYDINLVELEFVLQLPTLLHKSGDAWQRWFLKPASSILSFAAKWCMRESL